MLHNIKDHVTTFEEKSQLAPLTVEEYQSWCNEETSKNWAEKYLDHPMPGELDCLSDEELSEYICPTFGLGDEEFF